MHTLELFSGTQSFSKGIKSLYPDSECITVDLLPKFSPTICIDILTWDYKIYPPGYFTIIWASPPCTEYSKAKTRGTRNLELADSLVKKAFEIIDYFNPQCWIVENVATGLLPKRMDQIRNGMEEKMYTADYCSYGKPYRKRTAFWCSHPLVLKHCGGKKKCQQMKDNKHIGSVGNGTTTYNSVNISSVWQKNSIPLSLIQDIINQMYNNT